MNKKNNLALYTLIFVGLVSLFTSSISAQNPDSIKSESPTKQCSGEKFVIPESISVGNNAFGAFIKVMSLPQGKRQKEFSNLSNSDKANIFKVQLALNFIKRPNLTREQKSLILDAISTVSADTYSKENPALKVKSERQAQELQTKALAIFPPNEAHEIFASMNGDRSIEIEILKKYEDMLSLPTSLRKKTIRESSPTEKNNYWKSQLIYHLATANLSLVQKSFITNVFPLMTDNSFLFPVAEAQSKNEETKTLEAFISKGFELFSKEEFFTIFMGYGLQKPVFEKTLKEENNLARACDCNWVCGWGQTCTSTSCAVSTDGCGIFGGSECSSYCLNN